MNSSDYRHNQENENEKRNSESKRIYSPLQAELSQISTKEFKYQLAVSPAVNSKNNYSSEEIMSVLGGKASCRRKFVLQVQLQDKNGKLVNKEMKITALLAFANDLSLIRVDETPALLEPPLFTTFNGVEFPSHLRSTQMTGGRATFKLAISLLSSKYDNQLFCVRFEPSRTSGTPGEIDAEALLCSPGYSKPIRSISRKRSKGNSSLSSSNKSQGLQCATPAASGPSTGSSNAIHQLDDESSSLSKFDSDSIADSKCNIEASELGEFIHPNPPVSMDSIRFQVPANGNVIGPTELNFSPLDQNAPNIYSLVGNFPLTDFRVQNLQNPFIGGLNFRDGIQNPFACLNQPANESVFADPTANFAANSYGLPKALNPLLNPNSTPTISANSLNNSEYNFDSSAWIRKFFNAQAELNLNPVDSHLDFLSNIGSILQSRLKSHPFASSSISFSTPSVAPERTGMNPTHYGDGGRVGFSDPLAASIHNWMSGNEIFDKASKLDQSQEASAIENASTPCSKRFRLSVSPLKLPEESEMMEPDAKLFESDPNLQILSSKVAIRAAMDAAGIFSPHRSGFSPKPPSPFSPFQSGSVSHCGNTFSPLSRAVNLFNHSIHHASPGISSKPSWNPASEDRNSPFGSLEMSSPFGSMGGNSFGEITSVESPLESLKLVKKENVEKGE